MTVTFSFIIDKGYVMSSQSLTRPATFIVKAEVFPIRRNTARLRAKAQAEMSCNPNQRKRP